MLINFTKDQTNILKSILEEKVSENDAKVDENPQILKDPKEMKFRMDLYDMVKEIDTALKVPSTQKRYAKEA